jgi:hypothetical protein
LFKNREKVKTKTGGKDVFQQFRRIPNEQKIIFAEQILIAVDKFPGIQETGFDNV